MENEMTTFFVVDDEGREVENEVLFTFESPDTGKHYIVYTDHTLDEYGMTKVYASIYNPDTEDDRLLPIETEEEWAMIGSILDTLQTEAMGDTE